MGTMDSIIAPLGSIKFDIEVALGMAMICNGNGFAR